MKIYPVLFATFLMTGCQAHSNANGHLARLSDGGAAPPSFVHAPKPKAQTGKRQFPLSSLKQITLHIGKGTLQTWVMNTEAKREEGLMFVTSKQIKDNQAMLFVFTFPELQEFWMKNTLIPLDIAFIGQNGTILNTRHMKAFDLTPIPSKGAAQYALEMKVGTLRRLRIHAGEHVAIPVLQAS